MNKKIAVFFMKQKIILLYAIFLMLNSVCAFSLEIYSKNNIMVNMGLDSEIYLKQIDSGNQIRTKILNSEDSFVGFDFSVKNKNDSLVKIVTNVYLSNDSQDVKKNVDNNLKDMYIDIVKNYNDSNQKQGINLGKKDLAIYEILIKEVDESNSVLGSNFLNIDGYKQDNLLGYYLFNKNIDFAMEYISYDQVDEKTEKRYGHSAVIKIKSTYVDVGGGYLFNLYKYTNMENIITNKNVFLFDGYFKIHGFWNINFVNNVNLSKGYYYKEDSLGIDSNFNLGLSEVVALELGYRFLTLLDLYDSVNLKKSKVEKSEIVLGFSFKTNEYFNVFTDFAFDVRSKDDRKNSLYNQGKNNIWRIGFKVKF